MTRVFEILHHPATLKHYAAEDLYTHTPFKIGLSLQVIAALGLKELILKSEPATAADLMKVHTREYIQKLRRCIQKLKKDQSYCIGEEAFVGPGSWDAILASAGIALTGVERLINQETETIYGLTTPGHHAEKNKAMGYCIVSNAALAAEKATEKGWSPIIFDLDIHEGNGTENCLSRQLGVRGSKVFYTSFHLRIKDFQKKTKDGKLHRHFQYPYRTIIYNDHVTDNCLNVGFTPGVKIGHYVDALENKVRDKLSAFIAEQQKHKRPMILILSQGYDTLKDDPIGLWKLSPKDLPIIISHIRQMAGSPKTLVLLEGGYKMTNLAAATAHVIGNLAHIPEKGIKAAIQRTHPAALELDKKLIKRRETAIR